MPLPDFDLHIYVLTVRSWLEIQKGGFDMPVLTPSHNLLHLSASPLSVNLVGSLSFTLCIDMKSSRQLQDDVK